MTEKVFFFVLLIVSFVALIVYDSYKMDQGEVGPVVKVLNFIGLTEYDNNVQKIYNDYEDFYDDINFMSEHLEDRQESIQLKWTQLLQERVELIEKMLAISQAYLDVSEVFEKRELSLPEAKKTVRMTEQLRAELARQKDGLNLINNSFLESLSYFNVELSRMIQQVLFVTHEDVSDFIYLEQEIRIEKERFTQYFVSWQERWIHGVEIQDQLIAGHLQKLQGESYTAGEILRPVITEHNSQVSPIFQSAQENTEEFKQLIYHYGFEYHKFLEDLGQMVGIDVNRLVADKDYALHINRTYMETRLPFRSLYLKAIEGKK